MSGRACEICRGASGPGKCAICGRLLPTVGQMWIRKRDHARLRLARVVGDHGIFLIFGPVPRGFRRIRLDHLDGRGRYERLRGLADPPAGVELEELERWARENRVDVAPPKRSRSLARGSRDQLRADLMDAQGGRCAICGETGHVTRGLHLDHDHSCPRCGDNGGCAICIRGLLCRNCNFGLGWFRDRPELLLEAYDYLRGYAEGRAEREAAHRLTNRSPFQVAVGVDAEGDPMEVA